MIDKTIKWSMILLFLLAIFIFTRMYALSNSESNTQYVLFTYRPSMETVECLSQKDVEFYIDFSSAEINSSSTDENLVYIKQEDQQKVKDCR